MSLFQGEAVRGKKALLHGKGPLDALRSLIRGPLEPVSEACGGTKGGGRPGPAETQPADNNPQEPAGSLGQQGSHKRVSNKHSQLLALRSGAGWETASAKERHCLRSGRDTSFLMINLSCAVFAIKADCHLARCCGISHYPLWGKWNVY